MNSYRRIDLDFFSGIVLGRFRHPKAIVRYRKV